MNTRRTPSLGVATVGLVLIVGVLAVLGGTGTSEGQAAVEMGLDMDIAGNTASSLGPVDQCHDMVWTGQPFDGIVDWSIDVYVTGDTLAPIAYDAWLTYENSSVHVTQGAPTDPLIKMPQALDLGGYDEGQAAFGAIYLEPPYNGIPGNGTLVRAGLDIGASGVVAFGLAMGAYRSEAGLHAVTSMAGELYINDLCPGGDADADGVLNADDNCPRTSNPGQQDTDLDGVGNVCDVCPSVPNPGQEDGDSDGDGDVCDNCPSISNPDQANHDTDPDGDACDADDDNDTLPDPSDNCPLAANPDQANHDADPDGDACDVDDDGDGFTDVRENYHASDPLDPQCINATNDDPGDDTKVNDGCAKKAGPSESGAACDNALDDDADTWVNDGCPLVGTRGESSFIEICDGLDNDADTAVDEGFDYNADTMPDCTEASVDTDGDTLVNTSDTNDDDDGNPEDPDWNDGRHFPDTLEVYIGSDTLDACPENPNDDAWPPDLNNNGAVIGFDTLFMRSSIGSTYGGSWYEMDKNYNRRYDLNANGAINGLDVLYIRPYIGTTCVQ